jgi:hypothetical protein
MIKTETYLAKLHFFVKKKIQKKNPVPNPDLGRRHYE